MRIANDVLATLGAAETAGSALKLTGRLDRSLYERTNKVLEAAGGKWNRKAQAHLFNGEAADRIDQIILSGEITMPQDFGYFPTPRPVVDRLVELADLLRIHNVLEPSAGRGNIARALTDAALVTCYELLSDNVQALQELTLDRCVVHQADFLTVAPEPIYDRVVMNPPFAKRADVHHVQHALRFLAPGGHLVSVMSAGALFRTDKLTADFRDLVNTRGGRFEELPSGSFSASGTAVNTVIAVIPA